MKKKPCPFCGSKAGLYKTNQGMYLVFCTNLECHIQPESGHRYYKKKKAIKHWNRRIK